MEMVVGVAIRWTVSAVCLTVQEMVASSKYDVELGANLKATHLEVASQGPTVITLTTWNLPCGCRTRNRTRALVTLALGNRFNLP
jgi:hypothetical protein